MQLASLFANASFLLACVKADSTTARQLCVYTNELVSKPASTKNAVQICTTCAAIFAAALRPRPGAHGLKAAAEIARERMGKCILISACQNFLCMRMLCLFIGATC
jgi:hypothetical protein